MIIAVASGKGGTGKTAVATNLAVALHQSGHLVQLIDCDVEAPNAHLFLHPDITERYSVTEPVPRVDPDKCNLCGRCAALCAFGAIVQLKDSVAVFDDLCHACGGCALVCPEDAITEVPREVGHVELGHAGGIQFATGELTIGHPRAVPVIKALRERALDDRLVILDVPPGTSCPVVEALKGVDYVMLVAEATPFGLNDLELAVEVVRTLELPHGLVINRVGIGDARLHEYADREDIPILAELRDSRIVGQALAHGELILETLADVHQSFATLCARIVHVGDPPVATGATETGW